MADFLIGISVIVVGLIFLMLSIRSQLKKTVNRRLQDYVREPASAIAHWTEESEVRMQELRGSFLSRTLIPAFRRLGSFFGQRTPRSVMDNYDRQLSIANYPLGLRAREFYGIRLIFSLLSYYLAYRILRQGFSMNSVLLSGIVLYVGSYLPKFWLNRMVRRRQNSIRKGLPDALDMLSVCVEAGLGFDQAVQRVSEYWKTPIGAELGQAVKEMGMGVSRQQALRDMSDKLDVDELSSFVAVILQSDQLGMSIADTLSAQAKQMRVERRFRAQEQARKVPLKMLFPMMIFILPALFAVVLGPAIPALMDFFQSLNR